MTQPDDSLAAAHATATDVLDLHKLTLIGLFTTPEGPAALIRAADGQVARIVPGTQALGVTVTAIGETQVLITGADGITLEMYMPAQD